MRLAYMFVVLLFGCCPCGGVGLIEIQAQAPPMASFEVASIRPQPWTNEGRVGVFVHGNTLTGEHVSLYRLVEFAYDLRTDDSQLSGGPSWARHGILSDVSGAESALYHVSAKAAEGSTP